jgi:hypothetical protein
VEDPAGLQVAMDGVDCVVHLERVSKVGGCGVSLISMWRGLR